MGKPGNSKNIGGSVNNKSSSYSDFEMGKQLGRQDFQRLQDNKSALFDYYREVDNYINQKLQKGDMSNVGYASAQRSALLDSITKSPHYEDFVREVLQDIENRNASIEGRRPANLLRRLRNNGRHDVVTGGEDYF